jgi:hypothetical protein
MTRVIRGLPQYPARNLLVLCFTSFISWYLHWNIEWNCLVIIPPLYHNCLCQNWLEERVTDAAKLCHAVWDRLVIRHPINSLLLISCTQTVIIDWSAVSSCDSLLAPCTWYPIKGNLWVTFIRLCAYGQVLQKSWHYYHYISLLTWLCRKEVFVSFPMTPSVPSALSCITDRPP